MTTHFTKFETNKKKEPKLFFCKSIILEQRPSGKKTGGKNFFRAKNGKKTAKIA